MSWTEDQLDRLRDRLALAKRQGAWLSADEGGIVLGLIRFWRRATKLAGFNGVAQGALPTIAECRTHGIRGIIVECRRNGCGNRRRLAWADLSLPDSIVFVDIAEHRRFRCCRCQRRAVIISADWPPPTMGLGSR